MDQYSSVGIATRYDLGGPVIDSRWRHVLQHPFTPTVLPTQYPVK